MKRVSLSLLSLVSTLSVTALGVVGCAMKSSQPVSEGDLATNESQLVSDDQAADQVDNDAEKGVDEPLSGATETDPGTPADGATDAELMEKVRTNPGRFFKPAGCITTTVSGNVATHVFKDCTGPYEMTKFNGTITSTYVRAAGSLTITHEATDFQINGATMSGKRVIVYTRSGTVVTRTRTGDWTGTTASGDAITHEANFVTTWDASTKCLTREGSAKTSVGARSFERTLSDYKRCGIGRLGCPESGTLVLKRTTTSGESFSLTIEFMGGQDIHVTRPSGAKISRKLVCRVTG